MSRVKPRQAIIIADIANNDLSLVQNADGQWCIPIKGAQSGTGTTAPADATFLGIEVEHTVATSVPDGKLAGLIGTKFRELIIAAYDRSQNAMGVVDKAPQSGKSGYWHMIDTTLDDSPTATSSEYQFIGDKDKVGFQFNTTAVTGGSSPSVDYVVKVSPDGTDANNATADIIMASGGEDAPVASITHSATGNDCAYLPDGFSAQYAKIVATGTSTSASSTLVCDAFMSWKKG